MRKYWLTDKLYFKVFVALVLGILAIEFLEIKYALAFPILLGLLLLSIYQYFKIYRPKFKDVLFFVILIYAGECLHYVNYVKRVDDATTRVRRVINRKVNHLVRIDKRAIEKKNSLKVEARLIKSEVNGEEVGIDQDIILYFPKLQEFRSLKRGEYYQINTYLAPPFEARYDFVFDYKRWLYREGIYATGYCKDVKYLGVDTSLKYRITHFHLKLRDYFEKSIEKYVDNKQAISIAKSMLIGIKSDMQQDLLEAYSDTGTIHILSISGLHFGMVIFFLGFVLKRFVKNQRLSFIIKHSISFLYAMVTGFSPPVFRSFLMFLSFDLEKILSVKPSIFNVLFFSACIILIFDSTQLFDIGFQLSYAALLGIILCVNPTLNQVSFQNSVLNKLWGIAVVTFVAWIFVAPFTMYYFNKLSLLGMFSNLIILPIVPLEMGIGFLMLLFSWQENISAIFGKLFSYIVDFQNGVVIFFQQIPFSSIHDIYLSSTTFLMLLGVLVILLIMVFSRKRIDFKVFIVCVGILMSWILYENYQNTKFEKSYFSSSFKYSYSLNYKNGKLIIFSDSIEYHTHKFFIKPLMMKHNVKESDVVLRRAIDYFEDKNQYSINTDARPQYLMLSDENKSYWDKSMEERDSFIVMRNIWIQHKLDLIKKLEQDLKYFIVD